jgi:PAS domain S-box-containing protein
MDADGNIADFNPAAERTFGYRQQDVIGRPLCDVIIPPDLRDAHRAGLAAYHRDGLERVLNRRLEMRGMRADGSEFPAELTIVATRHDGVVFFTAHLRDLSDQKQAQESLRRLNADLEDRVRRRTIQLQAAIDELEAFSYSVSHDLRAPLRSIAGFSQALLEDAGTALPADAKEDLTRIRAATQRMGHLIDDLLSLAMLSRAPLTREPVDLSDLATRILGELGSQSPHRSVAGTVAANMTAAGDPRLLRVVLENLLTNAWKFTSRREHACIEVGYTDREDVATVFYVRDNGVGFDARYADKLFGPFQRLHHVRDFPGTGIGLATVRRIVQRHGGRVWAESQVGQGASFFFTLT